MIYRRSLMLLCLTAVLAGLLAHNIFAQNLIHIVAKGDTLFSLSRRYQVSQEEIMRRNGIADASRIQVGMRLTIPSGSSAPAASSPAATPSRQAPAPATAVPYTHYTVVRNDTLYSIARTRGITLQALRDMNGFSRDYVIKAGERIKVPVSNTDRVQTASPPPSRREPAQPEPRRASLSIKWPVAAQEVIYMNGKLPGVLVTGMRSESVRNLSGGTVISAGPYRGYGNLVIVESEGGYLYIYGAFETISVKQGDRVEAGTELGKLGIYAATGKPDLVFLVYRNDAPIDPARAPRAL